MEADELLLARVLEASLVAEPIAMLLREPQSAASVVPLTLTVLLPPLFISPNEQLRDVPPETAQPGLLELHTTPAGKVSVRVTLRAIPSPSFLTRMV